MKSLLLVASFVALVSTSHTSISAQETRGGGWYTPTRGSPPSRSNALFQTMSESFPVDPPPPPPWNDDNDVPFSEEPQPDVTTPEIEELARGLRYDPALIYEYVINNIRYQPYAGTLKGATLTLLEQSGNDFDQAALLVALLRASGLEPSYKFATVKMYTAALNAETNLEKWLGCTGSDAVENALWYNGIMIQPQSVDNTLDGPLAWIELPFVWVEVRYGGRTRKLTPAFKFQERHSGIELAPPMGYQLHELLQAAGGEFNQSYAKNISRSGIEGKLSLYSQNLIAYLRSYMANADVDQVIGGYHIQHVAVAELPTSLPFEVTSTITTWTSSTGIPKRHWAAITFQGFTSQSNYPYSPDVESVAPYWAKEGATPKFTYKIPTHALAGRKVSLTFDGAEKRATLRLDDVAVVQEAGDLAGEQIAIRVHIQHPYTFHNLSSDNGYNQGDVDLFSRTGPFSFFYSFGGSKTGETLHKRERILDELRNTSAGESEISSETLFILGLKWINETEAMYWLASDMFNYLFTQHHKAGWVKQEIRNGKTGFVISASYWMVAMCGRDDASTQSPYPLRMLGCFASGLEHSVIEQNQPTGAASAAKIVKLANDAGHKILFFDSAASFDAQWGTLGANGYPASVKENIDRWFAEFSIGVVLLPEQYGYEVQEWTGGAYSPGYRYPDGRCGGYGWMIPGGHGGASGADMAISSDYMSYYYSSDPSYYGVRPSTHQNPMSPEPVDLATGAYTYASVDLNIGQAEPRGLTLSRSYSSHRNRKDSPFGPGWVHNYLELVSKVEEKACTLR